MVEKSQNTQTPLGKKKNVLKKILRVVVKRGQEPCGIKSKTATIR